jgi:hypothetical protein
LLLKVNALGGRRGGYLRADCAEISSSSLLDVLQALRQKLGITLEQLDVVGEVLGCEANGRLRTRLTQQM